LIQLKIYMIPICVIVFSISFFSCTKDDPTSSPPLPLPPSMTGTWSGILTAGNDSATFLLDLSQDVVPFSGSGDLGSLPLSVNGESHYPVVTFTCSATGYQSFSFTGTFSSPSELSGFVNGSGFIQAVVVLTRN
jgi:hypothetical protein